MFIAKSFAACAFVPPRQSGDLISERFQQTCHAIKLLSGEDFRRRHEGRLIAGIDRFDSRKDSDQCLARADIALKHPAHGVRLFQVLGNLFYRPDLCRRHFIRQTLRYLIQWLTVRA